MYVLINVLIVLLYMEEKYPNTIISILMQLFMVGTYVNVLAIILIHVLCSIMV